MLWLAESWGPLYLMYAIVKGHDGYALGLWAVPAIVQLQLQVVPVTIIHFHLVQSQSCDLAVGTVHCHQHIPLAYLWKRGRQERCKHSPLWSLPLLPGISSMPRNVGLANWAASNLPQGFWHLLQWSRTRSPPTAIPFCLLMNNVFSRPFIYGVTMEFCPSLGTYQQGDGRMLASCSM